MRTGSVGITVRPLSVKNLQRVTDCEFCGREKSEVAGCLERRYVFDDASPENIERADGARDLVKPIAYGDETPSESSGVDEQLVRKSERCPYCDAEDGNPHHPLCTVEECPSCGERLWFCACRPRVLTRV